MTFRIIKDVDVSTTTTGTLASTAPPFIFNDITGKATFTDGTSTAFLDAVVDSASLRITSRDGAISGDIGQLEFQGNPSLCQLGVNGTPEAPLPQTQFAYLGKVVWGSYDGVASVRSGAIRAQTTQNWSPTEHGTGIVLECTKGLVDVSVLTAWEDRVQISDFGNTFSVPNASAILELESTTKAFILPRMTTGQMNAIPNPFGGMLVFNVDDQKFWGFSEIGPGWQALAFAP